MLMILRHFPDVSQAKDEDTLQQIIDKLDTVEDALDEAAAVLEEENLEKVKQEIVNELRAKKLHGDEEIERMVCLNLILVFCFSFVFVGFSFFFFFILLPLSFKKNTNIHFYSQPRKSTFSSRNGTKSTLRCKSKQLYCKNSCLNPNISDFIYCARSCARPAVRKSAMHQQSARC